jgi:hypothetical protein
MVLLGDFSFELAPLFFGPTEFLRRGSEVQEVHRNDVGSGPQVGVTNEGVELAAGLRQPGLDSLESLLLLFGVDVSAGRSQAYSLGTRVLFGRLRGTDAKSCAASGNLLPARRLERTTLVLECTSALSQ